ncbi:SAM-dependent methyltransferase [Mesorhizobium sp. B1-1-7]|uniref:SAM-dependent methyltransferase n=1 Tax=Mesorhizobium sp. B1-1-7 TaxID=2589977 RepID=UPI0015E416C2|nr:SAM-dependent methyltransferase [Mesorhizobium sp. B1-1-7]
MNARTSSTAVMARRVESADSLDYFPTPPWSTRAFCTYVLPRFELLDPATGLFPLMAIDPACGEGHMALALREFFPVVTATDIFDYGFGGVADFLHPDHAQAPRDWIITNPPFNLGPDFILHALDIARRGVAMLVRIAFLEGEGRYARLFKRTPPSLIAQYVERVPMHRGRWVIDGKSATAYCWLVWHKPTPRAPDPPFMWIPKSRVALSRPDDWLRFGGCMDLPKTHRAMVLAEQGKKYREPVLTLAQVRAEAAAKRYPASIGDIARELGALL